MVETLLLGLRVALSLAVVLVLLWLGARQFRDRTAGGRRPTSLTVLARQSLGRHAGVAVVEVEGSLFLLGTGDTGVRLLAQLDGGTPEGRAEADHALTAGWLIAEGPADAATPGAPAPWPAFGETLAAQADHAPRARGRRRAQPPAARPAGAALARTSWTILRELSAR